MKLLVGLAHVLVALTMPLLMVGLINRTKSLWAGRKGPPLLQSAWDLLRLLRKRPVYSAVTTPLFPAGAWVVLTASLAAALIAPLFGSEAPLQFDHDFIVFAYTLSLARIFLMLSAMDVGSSFEGMGAAREATFTAFIEPALFLLLGTACLVTGQTSFAGLLGQLHASAPYPILVAPMVLILFVLLQAEAARVPVDDPSTHLELTMVHEVMILDHSGPELAAMQYASAIKISIYAGLIAVLLNPFNLASSPLAAILSSLLIMAIVAVAIGCVESLVARLPMRLVPRYLLLASTLGAMVLGVAGWLMEP
ncbi:MAG: NADH-quinone oxidoreductase subunit H [Burkholderiaceae bacterium]|nr:NADH-quinone oxidoreductase subunit H [Desulfobacterales bacterium]MDP3139727.1 NADH-quinone oxidoreductase subunit H [Burkholderiaceae bacterium]